MGPHVTALGDTATHPVVIASQGLVWGKCVETQMETFRKAKGS